MSVEIPIFFACLLASGFFSGSETALLSAGRLSLRRLAGEGDVKAQQIISLVEDPRRLLAGILVGNNIVNVLAAVVAGAYFTRLSGPNLGPILATGVATVLIVLFSEFLPKTVAALHAIGFARVVARPIRWSLVLLSPLVAPLEAITRPLGAMLGRKRERLGLAEMRMALAEGIRAGGVDATMARVLRGGLSLEWKTVGDILVPRVDVVGVDGKAGFDQCLEVFREEHYSRILVMDESPDADVGYLAIKDLTLLPKGERETWTARDGAREALRVPMGLPLSELLARMRGTGAHFAIVKDEYGGTEGIATLEDVLEELVGEIRDEHDVGEIPPVLEVRRHLWLVRGDVSVKELHDRLGLDLGAEGARTAGGFVAEALGRVPEQGDVVELEEAGVKMVVVRVEENRVLQVRLEKVEPPPTSSS